MMIRARRGYDWATIAGAVLLALAVPVGGLASPRPAATVVLLIFDSWAPALIEPQAPPALQRIQREGRFTHHLMPEFPASTVVTQVTLSTGCRPSTHGVVNDRFLDSRHGRFDGHRDRRWLSGCEHLHDSARRQGVEVATWGWLDEQPRPAPEAERAAEVAATLQRLDGKRQRLLIAYFDQLGQVARRRGLNSEATRAAVNRSDAVIGEIMAAVERSPVRKDTTLIIVSGHGLLPVWTNVNVARILRDAGVQAEVAASHATAFLYFDGRASRDRFLQALSAYQRQFSVGLRESHPPEWHLGASERVGDVILVAHPPYFIDSLDHWPAIVRWLLPWAPALLWARPLVKATSGYPPVVRGMPGLLYAWGAGIPSAGEVARLRSIDLHPTVCALLGISPGSPVDGLPMAEVLGSKD